MDLIKRNTSLDIARLFALFSVVSVHFFLYNGFYYTILDGTAMTVSVFIRTLSMVCVPLFLYLTGYLMSKKTLSVSYYKSIDKVLGVYVLASVVCYVFKKQYARLPDISFFGITDYTLCDYAWYVEMYLGLFLLIPFLNLIYNGLTTKKQKQALILTLFVLTMLPCIVNVYDFQTPGFFANPAISIRYQKIVPAFWVMSYPLTYYFTGAYLREYPTKLGKPLNLLLIFGSLMLFAGYCLWRCSGVLFDQGVWQNWQSPLLYFLSLAVFIFFTELKTDNLPSPVRALLGTLSDISFGAYLMTCVFDRLFYEKLMAYGTDFTSRLPFYPVFVPATFLLSLFASCGLTFLFRLLKTMITAISDKLRTVIRQTRGK